MTQTEEATAENATSEERAAPKYQQAYGALRGRIVSGRYAVGGRLPTEQDLARAFDISRVTIRRSLDMLVNEGFLERRQGSGYTVVSLSPPSSTCLTSFTEAMMRAGREPSSKLLSITEFGPSDPRPEAVAESLADNQVICVERLRSVDEVPAMLVRTWAPAELLPGAEAKDFPEFGPNQSILRILAKRFGLEWSTACEDIAPEMAQGDIATHLKVQPGTPILVQACTAFDEEGRPVFYEQVFRLGKISFNLSGGAREENIVAEAG